MDSNRDLHQIKEAILYYTDYYEKDADLLISTSFAKYLINTYISSRNANMNTRSVDLYNNYDIILILYTILWFLKCRGRG
jgi:hypothetical protein